MLIDYESYVDRIKSTKEWNRLEGYRLTAKRRRILSWFVGLGVVFLGLLLLLFGEIFSGLSAPIVAVFLVIYLRKKAHKDYSQRYKMLVVPKLLSDVINNYVSADSSGNAVSVESVASAGKKTSECTYFQKKHINFDLLLEIPLFENYDHKRITYTGEDLFVGKLGETSFQFSDFVIKQNRDIPMADQDIDLTVFKGLIFIADFHKAFEGTTTLITRKGKKYKRQRFIGSRMRTLSHEFDQQFNIFTTDEITARYLLPANMLERILNLRKLIPGEGMAICLHEGKLVISLHNVDLFESDGLKQLNRQGVERTSQEIRAILEIIDLLNLNLRLWNKTGQKGKWPLSR